MRPSRFGDLITRAEKSRHRPSMAKVTSGWSAMRPEFGPSFPRRKSHRLLSSSGVDFMLLAEAVEKTRMPKAKSALFAASVAIISTGLVIIGVGAFFLKRLDTQP